MATPASSFLEVRYAPLLARRVPVGEVVIGRAYVIHARNGGVGVAVREEGRLGYVLHREKWGDHFLFTEIDWSEGSPYTLRDVAACGGISVSTAHARLGRGLGALDADEDRRGRSR